MTFPTVMMKGAVNFIKTVFTGAGTSKKDERLQILNVDWMIDSSITPELVKARAEYSKMS